MFDPKKILVLAPHTDDGELGCGASIAKWCSEGRELYYAAFCVCARSLPAAFPPNTLARECRKDTATMGIPESNLLLFKYDVRE